MDIDDILSYSWKERPTCYELCQPQGSDQWKKARIGCCTSTVINKVLGDSVGITYLRGLARQVCGLDPPPAIPPEQRSYIDQGILREDEVRQMTATKLETSISEVSLMVSKTNPYIRASPDGEMKLPTHGQDNINLEIKVCQKMYYPAAIASQVFKQTGAMPPPSECMFKSHYDQITTAMAVSGASGCIYSVACFNTNEHFITHVPFDHNYWLTIVPIIENFHDDYIYPLLRQHQISVVMPPSH